jgi:anti-sigma regulatory factor (Ser/Thr protein kinase)
MLGDRLRWVERKRPNSEVEEGSIASDPHTSSSSRATTILPLQRRFGSLRNRTGRPPTVEDGLTLHLSGGPEAAARARRALGTLGTDLDQPLRETLHLLVTELVANAVKHGKADSLTIKVAVGGSWVLTEVIDEGPGFDADGAGNPRQDHTGWGLYLVETLAQRWGVARDGRATRVWFELARG